MPKMIMSLCIWRRWENSNSDMILCNLSQFINILSIMSRTDEIVSPCRSQKIFQWITRYKWNRFSGQLWSKYMIATKQVRFYMPVLNVFIMWCRLLRFVSCTVFHRCININILLFIQVISQRPNTPSFQCHWSCRTEAHSSAWVKMFKNSNV